MDQEAIVTSAPQRIRSKSIADEAARDGRAEQAGVEIGGDGLPLVGLHGVIHVEARSIQLKAQRHRLGSRRQGNPLEFLACDGAAFTRTLQDHYGEPAFIVLDGDHVMVALVLQQHQAGQGPAVDAARIQRRRDGGAMVLQAMGQVGRLAAGTVAANRRR